MMKKCLVLVVLLALASNVLAGRYYSEWRGPEGGAWNVATAVGTNWSIATVPIASVYTNGTRPVDWYQAGFKGFGATPGTVRSPGITDGITVAADVISAGGTLGGRLTIDGGTVNVSEYITLAASGTEVGVLEMKSGALNTGIQSTNAKLILGQSGKGTLNMTGGIITIGDWGTGNINGVRNNLELCQNYLLNTTTNEATVNLDGGTIYAANLVMQADAVTAGKAKVIITDGMLVLSGNDTVDIDTWIDGGAIRGGEGYTAYSAFDSDASVTYVWAEVPEPATMSLLGLGVLGLLRRNKK